MSAFRQIYEDAPEFIPIPKSMQHHRVEECYCHWMKYHQLNPFANAHHRRILPGVLKNWVMS